MPPGSRHQIRTSDSSLRAQGWAQWGSRWAQGWAVQGSNTLSLAPKPNLPAEAPPGSETLISVVQEDNLSHPVLQQASRSPCNATTREHTKPLHPEAFYLMVKKKLSLWIQIMWAARWHHAHGTVREEWLEEASQAFPGHSVSHN